LITDDADVGNVIAPIGGSRWKVGFVARCLLEIGLNAFLSHD
jgi:hypothetical protein